MNRVYLVAAKDMAEKVKVASDAVAAAGLKTAVYKPSVNGEAAVAMLKSGESAVLMEKIAADFIAQNFDAVDVVIVEGAQGMSDAAAYKYNDKLATALDAKIFCGDDDADLYCPNRIMHCPKCIARNLSEPAAERKTSQAMFRAGLLQKASKSVKRIVLPEGSEPRTVQAAALAVERGIAVPVLIGKKAEIEAVAKEKGVKLPANIEIIEPSAELAEKYVPTLVELRKAKGMTEEAARAALADNVMLGTMMLKMGEVDGLVSGAIHSTADTLRPALQIIKTAPGVKSVSSVFFMCLPGQTYVYGDCAINLNPTAEELAGIALQCDDTAKAFGLPSRVAMLSYSTINSGKGPDADLVKEATAIAKAARPDMALDGPLQYDAATTPSVGSLKAPNSAVAGKATVFVFPDLSAGNIGYKAVQRSAQGTIAIGPMLQGLAKPVNDLSRGALVEDIVYTIALTAVQAQ
ncbi:MULTISPECIES: phosphate acetyltransferase [unclassified Fibrobacter]|uniref:phosphate acetyltransferase n=1 Tax=unclassified Fibrobacter TaxID=2634177 RepID=UPI000D6B7701|nr:MULTISPECIES: phosphate acetyltransferase [unclassified Fibrobacter]PWJ68359.1 phosphate acetyltransferase [Fibrobacter sp. UWR4]PZW68107.1 phosphate acetyltransferase [Fibrobacter sp. UWR1]